MLKHEEIFEGSFIVSDYNTLGKKSVGIIQNVRKAVENGLREHTYPKRPEEFAYNIFFPETGETAKNILEYSGVTTEAIPTTTEKAQLFFEQRISANNEKILSLRAQNILIKESFEKIFLCLATV